MAWNNGYPTSAARHSRSGAAVARAAVMTGSRGFSAVAAAEAAAAAAARRAAMIYGPRILLHGSGIGLIAALLQGAWMFYNWWNVPGGATVPEDNGWTKYCDNGTPYSQFGGITGACGGYRFLGGIPTPPAYQPNVSPVGSYTAYLSAHHILVPGYGNDSAKWTRFVPAAEYPLAAGQWVSPSEPRWFPVLPGLEVPAVIPAPQALPIGFTPGKVVAPPYRNTWGRSIGVAPINVPGNPPVTKPVTKPIVITVPIPGTRPQNPPIPWVPPGTTLPTPGIPGTVPVVTYPPIVTPIPVDPVVVVPRAPTYVAANQGVALAHTPHRYAPPPRGTKEAKVKGVPRAAMVVLGTVTEALDVLDCLHRALPKSRQIHRYKKPVAGKAVYAANRGAQNANRADGGGLVRGFTWATARPVDKFHAVKNNLQHVDLPGAITCMYEEQILDIAFGQLGKISGKAAAAARLHGALPIGFQTGYAH